MKIGYRKNILANGLRVVSFRMPQRESFSLGIFIKVGGR